MFKTPIAILISLLFAAIIVAASNLEEDFWNDLEDQCGAVCYPTVRPLLQYVESCHHQDLQVSTLKDKARNQDIEMIKLKSTVDSIKEFNKQLTASKASCGQNNTLKQAIETVNQIKVEFNYELKKLQSVVREYRMKI